MGYRPILVTGVGGFLGKSVFDFLNKSRYKERVIGTSRSLPANNKKTVFCELTDWKSVSNLICKYKPSWIFHCAGTTVPGPWKKLFDAHVVPTLFITQSAQLLSTKTRIIVVGSAAEYGDVPKSHVPIRETEPLCPTFPYGISKKIQTSLSFSLARRNVEVVTVRLFNLLSQNMGSHLSVTRFIELLKEVRKKNKKVIRTGSLQGVRDFLDISDVCRGLICVAKKGLSGESYNLCSGKPVLMRDVLHELMRLMKTYPKVEEEKLSKIRTSVSYSVGDFKKVRKQTGWAPRKDWKSVLADFFL